MPLLLGDRYRVGERIGTGGSSHVYEAFDERLDRPVAVKLLDEAAATTADPAAATTVRERIPNRRTVLPPERGGGLDAGSDQGNLFLVMELVTGGSLAQRLADDGPMPSSAVAKLGSQLASALAAAHAAGIIHRDVKPSNVLLGADGNAKLADFGIARRFDEIEHALTSTGMVIGTREFVSPEQARGEPLGPATDIFSLGVTLYEAATGIRPMSAIERPIDSRLDVRAIDPTIDAALASVIDRATAIPIEARFADAGQMAGVLAGAATAGLVGGTALLPEHLAPQPGPAAMAAPLTSSTTGAAAGAAGALIGDQLLDERRHRQRLIRAGVGIALLVTLIGALVVALGDDDEPSLSASSTTAAAEVATTLAATTIPPTTIPPTTVAPTTAAPPTAPPTTLPPPPPELIPGFPLPADVGAFLAILAANPGLVGPRGDDLAEELDNLLTNNRGKFEDRKAELMDHIEEWRDDGELDPIVAAAALALVGDLDKRDGRDGGD